MQITLVCKCGHINWMHTFYGLVADFCNLCRCEDYKTDNLKSLEYTSGSYD